jgi:glutamyl-tRNA synthetase
MHLGNARTALLAWLDARSRGGAVVLRIEDLDTARCRPEFAELVRVDLRWLGLDWDAETQPQSGRGDLYAAATERLARMGLVYECFCSRRDLDAQSAPHESAGERRYPGTCAHLSPAGRVEQARTRAPALRVRMGSDQVEIDDRVLGPIRQRVDLEVGDVLVRRSDGLFAYQLAVVVDDAADGVTDVVRGADLASSTPRQVLIGELLGLARPAYAHVPLMLGDDGQRLAKRNGARSVAALRESGANPADIVGVLAASAGLIGAPEPLRPSELLDRFTHAPWRPA